MICLREVPLYSHYIPLYTIVSFTQLSFSVILWTRMRVFPQKVAVLHLPLLLHHSLHQAAPFPVLPDPLYQVVLLPLALVLPMMRLSLVQQLER